MSQRVLGQWPDRSLQLAMVTTSQLRSLVGRVLRKHGFKGNGNVWIRSLPDLTQAVAISKSRYSGHHQLVLGINLKGWSVEVPRSELKFQMDCTAHNFVQPMIHEWASALDGESSMSLDERMQVLDRGFREGLEPAFAQLDTLEKVRAYVNEPDPSPWSNGFVMDQLGIPHPDVSNWEPPDD